MRKTLILLLLAGMAASISAQTVAPVNSERASNPNQVVGQALQTTGVVSLSVGVPCLAAGMACLMYANFVPNPMDGYTTNQSKADADRHLQYITMEEYKEKAQSFTASTHAAEVAGYIPDGRCAHRGGYSALRERTSDDTECQLHRQWRRHRPEFLM